MDFSGASFLKNNRLRIILILMFSLFVRLLGITSRPIWYDEAFSILFSEKGLGQMLFGTLAHTPTGSAEEHPLGYYILLWKWMGVFGNSLVSARMLSIVAGILIVYLVYKISLILFDIKTAETAMLISAVLPFLVHYAQEIRMYSYLALWLLLATYSYLRASSSRNWRWWLIFALSSALAQYTHSLAAFFLVPLAATPLINRDWKTLRSVFLSGCVAILLYLPWLTQLPSQFAKVGQAYWVSKPGISSLITLLLVFTANTPLPNLWVLPALAIALLIFTIGIMQTVKCELGTNKKNGLWVLYLSFATPVLLFLFSQWKPIYIERAFLPSSAFFCIWLAWIYQKTNLPNVGRSLLLMALAGTFAIGIYQHVTYKDFPYGPFKEIDAYMRDQLNSGDRIIHSNKLSLLPATYFDNSLPQTFIGDIPNSATDTLAPATQQVLKIKAETDIKSATSQADRVWYIIYQRSIDEYTQAGQDTHPDINFLLEEFSLESQETRDGLQVYLFTKNP